MLVVRLVSHAVLNKQRFVKLDTELLFVQPYRYPSAFQSWFRIQSVVAKSNISRPIELATKTCGVERIVQGSFIPHCSVHPVQYFGRCFSTIIALLMCPMHLMIVGCHPAIVGSLQLVPRGRPLEFVKTRVSSKASDGGERCKGHLSSREQFELLPFLGRYGTLAFGRSRHEAILQLDQMLCEDVRR